MSAAVGANRWWYFSSCLIPHLKKIKWHTKRCPEVVVVGNSCSLLIKQNSSPPMAYSFNISFWQIKHCQIWQKTILVCLSHSSKVQSGSNGLVTVSPVFYNGMKVIHQDVKNHRFCLKKEPVKKKKKRWGGWCRMSWRTFPKLGSGGWKNRHFIYKHKVLWRRLINYIHVQSWFAPYNIGGIQIYSRRKLFWVFSQI